MYIICRTGYDFLCPQLLEQRRCFQRGLKPAAEGNDTNIIVSYTKRTEKFLIGAVTDPCVGHIRQDIVDMLTTDQNIEYDEAMNKFYNSEVFEKLQDRETGLYLESSEYIYDLFKDEINFGRIVQAEI